jgi:hypothetical protein
MNTTRSLDEVRMTTHMRDRIIGRLFVVIAIGLVSVGTSASAQTGTSYRFQQGTAAGRVWVLGENARKEIEPGEPGTPAEHGRVEIWKDGGKQLFVVDPVDHTYYEENTYRKQSTATEASLDILTVRAPFHIDGVQNLKLDLTTAPRPEVVSGYSCQRTTLSFSYQLKLSLQQIAGVAMIGRVAGAATVCMVDAPQPLSLPFGHRAQLVSGIAAVDVAAAKRLSSLSGIAVSQTVTATRQIDNGEAVSGRYTLTVSDIQPVEISPERFEIPKDYRFREPVVAGPVRKQPASRSN